MRLQRDAARRRAPEACRSAMKNMKLLYVLILTLLSQGCSSLEFPSEPFSYEWKSLPPYERWKLLRKDNNEDLLNSKMMGRSSSFAKAYLGEPDLSVGKAELSVFIYYLDDNPDGNNPSYFLVFKNKKKVIDCGFRERNEY